MIEIIVAINLLSIFHFVYLYYRVEQLQKLLAVKVLRSAGIVYDLKDLVNCQAGSDDPRMPLVYNDGNNYAVGPVLMHAIMNEKYRNS